MELRKKIILEIEKRGLRQCQISKEVGITQSQISQYLRGWIEFSEKKLVKLCGFLNLKKEF